MTDIRASSQRMGVNTYPLPLPPAPSGCYTAGPGSPTDSKVPSRPRNRHRVATVPSSHTRARSHAAVLLLRRLEHLLDRGREKRDVLRLRRLDNDGARAGAGAEADLGEHDEAVERLDREVDHVGFGQLAARNEKDGGRLKLRADLLDDLGLRQDAARLYAVLLRSALPLLEEDLLVEATVGHDEEQQVGRVLEVVHLDVRLDGHLHEALGVGERAVGQQRQHAGCRLAWLHRGREDLAQGRRRLRVQPERILVELDSKIRDGRHRLVLDRQPHAHAPVLLDEGAAQLHAVSAIGGKDDLVLHGGRGGRAHPAAEEVVEAAHAAHATHAAHTTHAAWRRRRRCRRFIVHQAAEQVNG
mmetsp:Transcript_551/g.1459  ORF Transcript_551/g.1459 Transcript_551/m.1459 type:complete len:357 (-) Transcript_551:1968-3038(-)